MAVMMLIKLVAKPGMEDQVREKYQWMATKMAELFPGVITFHAFQSPGSPSEWQCVEIYASQEVFKRHVSDTDELQKWAMDFRPLIESFSADMFVEGEELSEFVKQRAVMQGGTLHPSGSWAGFEARAANDEDRSGFEYPNYGIHVPYEQGPN